MHKHFSNPNNTIDDVRQELVANKQYKALPEINQEKVYTSIISDCNKIVELQISDKIKEYFNNLNNTINDLQRELTANKQYASLPDDVKKRLNDYSKTRCHDVIKSKYDRNMLRKHFSNPNNNLLFITIIQI